MLGLILEHGMSLIVVLPLFSSLLTFAANKTKIGEWSSLITASMTNIIAMVMFAHTFFGKQELFNAKYYFGGWRQSLGIEFSMTPLNSLMILVVHLVYLLVCAFATESWRNKTQSYIVFYTLLNLFIAGMTGMTLSNDAFNIFVFMEIASIAGYSMVALGDQKKASVAAFNYLIVGSLGASCYLLGVGIIYLDTGVLNLSLLRMTQPHDGAETLASLLIMAGLAIKMSLFPLHLWLVNSYRSAPTSFSMCSSAISTKVFMLVMIKVWTQLFADGPLGQILIFAAMTSMVLGAFMAYMAQDIRSILAYSSVSQIGYILAGFLLKTAKATEASSVAIVGHSFVQVSMFALIGVACALSGTNKHVDISVLPKKSLLSAICIVILLASIVGVPGTVGFISKWLLIQSAVSSGQWLLVAAVVLSSVLAVGYCLKLAQWLWLDQNDNAIVSSGDTSVFIGTSIILLGALVILGGGLYARPMHLMSLIINQGVVMNLM